MTRDEAINQLSDAGVLLAGAVGALEATDGGPEFELLHALASRLGWRLEAKLNVPGGTFVKAYDGTPKPGGG